MIFVVDVREDKQKTLGAVTHVNGSARVQTVSKRTNPRYWSLISEFKALTGVPVVLNTSFNNNAEPIVDSVEDAVVSFLTTNLHYLVVGDHLVKKKDASSAAYRALVPGLPRHVKIAEQRRFDGKREVVEHAVASNADKDFKKDLSADAYEVLLRADGAATLGELAEKAGVHGDERGEALVKEMIDLWSWRVITLSPRA
jgi:carbamoyltransferase